MLSKRYITPLIIALLFAGILIVWPFVLNQLDSQKWENEVTHAIIEIIGALIALLMWYYLILKKNHEAIHFKWISLGFLAMGILDTFHAFIPAGNSFIYLHSMAGAIGGLFFALSWWRPKFLAKKNLGLTWGVVIFTIGIGLFSLLLPDKIPSMIQDGQISSQAIAINLTGAILYGIAIIRFSVDLKSTENSSTVQLIILLSILFSVSGFMFKYSQLWDHSWWLFHFLRFAAFLFTFAYLLRRIARNQADLLSKSGLLRVQQNEIELVNEQLKKQTESLKSSEEKLIAQQQKMVAFNTELEEKNLSLEEQKLEIIERNKENERNNWLKTGQAELDKRMRGIKDLDQLCSTIITFICNYLQIEIGSLYILCDTNQLCFKAGYAFDLNDVQQLQFNLGEGFIGQAAQEKTRIIIDDVPEGYIQIKSSLGTKSPEKIMIAPLLFDEQLIGVYELASFHQMDATKYHFLDSINDSIAITIHSLLARIQLDVTLSKTQLQAEELQVQQEELEKANEELRSQTEVLQKSEEKLLIQQEELRTSNEELANKTLHLEEQKKEIDKKNRTLEEARNILSDKAHELEITSKYKSEFLANMSHELRTPLNSLLILAQKLCENKEKNLEQNQIKALKVIFSSGNDLLNLINEILDLSKIESGRMDVNFESVAIQDIKEALEINFLPLLKEKEITFSIEIDSSLPSHITTDKVRIEQVLKNLVSNAIKFTESGSISVSFTPLSSINQVNSKKLHPENAIAIAVSDTGLGIPPNKQKLIFEAFQQVDGSISRKYGGTGLGLSISREIANLLGGEIHLKSKSGEGSTFTLLLPIDSSNGSINSNLPQDKTQNSALRTTIPNNPSSTIRDDRENINTGDPVLLLVDNDLNNAQIIRNQCNSIGIKCIHTANGQSVRTIATDYQVDAIILEMQLPDIQGEEILLALKEDPNTRHIPIQILSREELSMQILRKGAIGILQKPINSAELTNTLNLIYERITSTTKSLLIVEDNKLIQDKIIELLKSDDLNITTIGNGAEALEAIKTRRFECVILDLVLPDISGFEILEQLHTNTSKTAPPIIVYTAKDLTREEASKLERYASSIILKGVNSDERLFEETSLFLHKAMKNLPVKGQQMFSRLHIDDVVFQDKSVLLVDDDMRNVFAISQVLEEKGMVIHIASNGKLALDKLNNEKNIDLVLMDIMMPVMDGYEAIRRIRSNDCFWKLPILALTAKAMKNDREKCLAVGANDYLAKPINIDRLLALMRVWLFS